jgi:SAM-dependent methyltransferase
VIDLGSGAGRDAVHLAAAGHRVTGFDYCGAALRAARRRARADTSAAVFEELNLYDTRRTLARSALLAHEGWVSGAMTRLLPNTLNHAGRANLWRLGRMVLRPGGRMYVEFVVPRRVDEATPGLPPTVLRPVTRDVIVAEVQASGGHVELDDVVTGRGLADERRTLCRMVVSWS